MSSEITVIKRLNDYWRSTEDSPRLVDWRQRARKGNNYYLGGDRQWDANDISRLDAEGRPHKTINYILSNINLISGFERQNRQDIKVFPRRGGTKQAAMILTELAKHAMDMSNAPYEESMAFLDGIIGGKGWWGLDIDYQYDPLHGDIVVGRRSPFNVREDPNCKDYDLNKSANFIVEDYWWDKETIKLYYPKKAKDLSETDLGIPPDSPDSYAEETASDYDMSQKTAANNAIIETLGVSGKATKYRVKDFWWKTYEKRKFLIHLETLEVKMINEWRDELAEAVMNKFKGKYKIVDTIVPVLHKTVTVGEVILEDIEDPFDGIALFPLFRFCPYWLDGMVMGMVDNAEDMQDEANKRRSQVLHHLNQSANSGWMWKKGTLDASGTQDIKQFGSRAGVNIEYIGDRPERIHPMEMSTGHFTLSLQAPADIERVMGIPAALLGQVQDKGESGVTVGKRQTQGATIQEGVLDNYRFTQQIFGEGLIELIRRSGVYSEEEIKSIVDESTIKDKIDFDKLKSFKTGRYGIKIDQSPNAPTIRTANFYSMLEALKMGIPIPPDLIVDASDWQRKEEIKERLAQQQQPAPAGGMPTQGGLPR